MMFDDDTPFVEYITKKYGEAKNDEECLTNIVRAFAEFVGQANDHVRDGIREYYLILKQRRLPAYQWMIEAIGQVSKKHRDKKNFAYIVGMLKSWMVNGFGYVQNSDEEEILDYFKEVTGQEASVEAKQLIRMLMGKYGSTKVTRMIGSLSTETIDMSVMYVTNIKDKMENVYGQDEKK